MTEQTYTPVVLCGVHQRPLIAPQLPAYCPICRAESGGRKRSKKQVAAGKKNLRRRWTKP